MKALAIFPTSRSVQVIDHPEPRVLKPTQARLRMLEVGVCGTDRELCEFRFGAPPRGADYLVLGHESLAEVVDAGDAVKGLQQGDLVVSMVRRPCPHAKCLACRAGRQDFCYTGEFEERGIRWSHGFMTEYVVEEAQYLLRLPSDLREVGVLIEPLTIAEKALIQVWQLQSRLPWETGDREVPGRGRRAVVLGAGPVGLLGAMLLVRAGFETTIYSRSPVPNPKAAAAEMFGARYLSCAEVPVAKMAEWVGPIDVVYEAVGATPITFEVMQHVATNGVFVMTGLPEEDIEETTQTGRLMRRVVLENQIILGTVNAGPDAFTAAVRDLAVFARRWPQALRAILTGRHRIESARDLLLGGPRGIKEIVALAE